MNHKHLTRPAHSIAQPLTASIPHLPTLFTNTKPPKYIPQLLRLAHPKLNLLSTAHPQRVLFADAKPPKYIPKHILRTDLPGNLRQMIHRLPYVLR